MIAVTCDASHTRVLLDLSAILTVSNGPLGPVAVYECACGAIERWPKKRPLAASTGSRSSDDPRPIPKATV